MSFAHPISLDCVVTPKNTSETQQVVKWANRTGTGLVPISSGSPHFWGDTVPSAGGVVIVDLSRMKKIIRVDARNRVALVEPGVTFSELQPEVEREELRLNMPLLPRSSKSVVASLLEREPVIMPRFHWDMMDPLACTEIIWGSGDLFRTGSAAGPGTLEELQASGSAQKYGGGPAQVDYVRFV